MKTSENSSNGSAEKNQDITIPQTKQQGENPSEDVSYYLETVTGHLINPKAPHASNICVDDIAWALSRIPRFAGHTITEVPYNVAQHSIYVSELVELLLKGELNLSLTNGVLLELEPAIEFTRSTGHIPETLIKALFHDGHEAYIGDIPSPIKKIPELNATFKMLESRLDFAIYSHLYLPENTSQETYIIKFCDKLAQAIEGYQFMPSRGRSWVLPQPTLELLQHFPSPLNSFASYKAFLDRYEYLRNQ